MHANDLNDRLICCVQAGVVSSSNSLSYSEADMKQMEANDAAVKEMEAAGIAWAAHLFPVPLFALKSVTDIVDGDRPAQEEFLENLSKAANALKVRYQSRPFQAAHSPIYPLRNN